MRQQQDSGPQLEIDEPFELSETDLEEFRPVTVLPPRLNTPGGSQELVDPAWLEEPTLVMPAEQVQELLREMCPHRTKTLPSMVAVVVPAAYPSQRPQLLVELVPGDPE